MDSCKGVNRRDWLLLLFLLPPLTCPRSPGLAAGPSAPPALARLLVDVLTWAGRGRRHERAPCLPWQPSPGPGPWRGGGGAFAAAMLLLLLGMVGLTWLGQRRPRPPGRRRR